MASVRLSWFALIAASFAVQFMFVLVSWQIYDLTRNPVFSGCVRLARCLLDLVTGFAAAWISTVWAVALGGVGTMVIAGVWSQMFPGLRKVRGH